MSVGGPPRTLVDAVMALRDGTVTATELVEGCLSAADAFDEEYGVYIERFTADARAQAHAADARLRAGAPCGPLDGIPVGLKDIVVDRVGTTTAQSLVLDAGWAQATGSSTVADRLRGAGAVVMGKLTTMEFATGLPDPSQPFPVPRNPWDIGRWAGGSSSGSASGLVLGMFLGAVGTDTAGSIRIPSAFSGTTGIKPTFGLVPKDGVVPLGYSLDHVGPMACSAADCALMLEVIAGGSARDPYSAARDPMAYSNALTGDLAGVTIGVDGLDRHAAAGIDDAQPARFAAALDTLADAGAHLVEVELPYYAEAVAADMVTMLGEAHAYHAPDLADRWHDYGRATRILLASADVLTAADYVQAQRVRRVIRAEVEGILHHVDLIATPTGHRGAPRLDELDPGNSLTALPSVHTPYWNPIGLPTVAFPIGLSSEKTPLSMSLTGRFWDEATVLRAADAYQRRSDAHLARPDAVRRRTDQAASA